MKTTINKWARKLGFEIKRYPNVNLKRKINLLLNYNINCVIDIGANVGQYASELRELGYKETILSFEPLTDAYKDLEARSYNDQKWLTFNTAVGNEDTESLINVSEMSVSSSILSMNENFIKDAYSKANYIRTEKIVIKKLDTILDTELKKNYSNIFLKIDAQGYEDKILEGAQDSIADIVGIQIEMSLVELYKGETLFIPMLNKLDKMGFELKSFEHGFYDPKSTELYQVDAILFRK
jgi:FkbM family methyltransferase